MSTWDDEAGYDVTDPKHPRWVAAAQDLADYARKAEAEADAPPSESEGPQ